MPLIAAPVFYTDASDPNSQWQKGIHRTIEKLRNSEPLDQGLWCVELGKDWTKEWSISQLIPNLPSGFTKTRILADMDEKIPNQFVYIVSIFKDSSGALQRKCLS